MPPRDPNLPEGTDSFIDDDGADLSSSSSLGMSSSGVAGSGGMGLGGSGGSLDREDMGMGAGLGGGFSGGVGGTDDMMSSGSGLSSGSSLSGGSSYSAGVSGGSTGGATSAVANSSAVQSLKTQASDKVRDVASQGKERATEALGNVTQLINDTAQTVDERLGPQYGDYVRQAASAIEGFSSSIQNKEVDELFDDARNLVRQSPGVALGVAATVGFLLVRLVKSGLPADTGYGASSGANDYAGGSTQRLASPPRVDNSYDPVA